MDPFYVYATAAVIVLTVVWAFVRRRFDPFAPLWLFLVGYLQVYVFQALTHREWALRAHGPDLVASANLRALWALLWFLAVYHVAGLSRWVSRKLPTPPRHWSVPTIGVISPPLIGWGLYCAGIALSVGDRELSDTEVLVHSFPTVLLVAGALLLITGRSGGRNRPAWTVLGLVIVVGYVLIWMFNAKRSHALFGVLVGLAAYYIPRFKRPSIPVLLSAGFVGALAVSIAIGWRNNPNYDRSAEGFIQFLGDFNAETILVNASLKDKDGEGFSRHPMSYETEENGGFLLMMDTVPEKADFDYGASYNRLWSTFIPRIIWPTKPYYGRDKWVAAWIAGSEFKRTEDFTGPAIGILGATQLNGGAVGTLIVLAILAVMIRSFYEYFLLHRDVPFVQAWWALTYYNAWLMTVNDDPFVWFYYNYGFTTFIPLVGLWIWLKLAGAGRIEEVATAGREGLTGAVVETQDDASIDEMVGVGVRILDVA